MSENTGSLDLNRIEVFYDQNAQLYDWNTMPQIRPGNEVAINESSVLDCFFYAAMRRMMKPPDQADVWPENWPKLTQAGTTEAVEYVVVRACIEHQMLGIILGRGGTEELGSTLWGQTELSCEFSSFNMLQLFVSSFPAFVLCLL